jgi:YVTN family beta-propeller protein
VIVSRTKLSVRPPAFTVSGFAVAKPARKILASSLTVNPCARNVPSVHPCGLPARISSARRCSPLRPRLGVVTAVAPRQRLPRRLLPLASQKSRTPEPNSSYLSRFIMRMTCEGSHIPRPVAVGKPRLLSSMAMPYHDALGGKGARWLTISHDDKTAYVANEHTNDVSVVDIKSLKEAARIPVGYAPARNTTWMFP